MFAYSVAIAFGGVEAADAEAFGIVYIDGLHAGTEATDAAEMAGVVEEGSVDDNFTADDECVELADDGEQGVVVEGGVDGDLIAGLSQEVVEDGVGVVCDEDSHNEVAI